MAPNKKEDSEKLLLLEKSPQVKYRGVPCRVILSIMLMLGVTNLYMMRVNLSVAIVAMTNKTQETHKENYECGFYNSTETEESSGEFTLSPSLQGSILGAFFYGYACTPLIGGLMAERFGGKWVMGLGVLLSAIFTLLTPLAANTHVACLIAVRVCEGLVSGVSFSALHSMWGVWAPPMERSMLVAFSMLGVELGTVVAMGLSGVLATSNFLGGWPSVFYVFGIIGCVWFIFWCFLAYNSPETHPRISASEFDYINSTLHQSTTSVVTRPKVPWCHIIRSMPLWAAVVCHFTASWGFYTMISYLPTYLSHILHLDLRTNSLVSSLSYLCMAFFMVVTSFAVDYLRSHKYLSTKNVRKIVTFMGLGISSTALVAICFAGCDKVLTIALLFVSVASLGFGKCGYLVTFVDIAPLFAGTLVGISNMVATTSGFISPLIVGMLTTEHETRQQWSYVFIISATLNFFGAIFYGIFVDGEVQPWAKGIEKKQNNDEKQTLTTSTKNYST